MVERQRDWPEAMTATTTHDTKRSEDTRARIAVLAELPDVWQAALDRLLELVPLPDPGFGSLLWQYVVGAWPASRERLHQYAEKAMREAGDHTSWPTPPSCDAVHAAVDAALRPAEVRSGRQRPGRRDPARAQRRPRDQAAGADDPGVPDVYTAPTGSTPGRPRQPPARGLRQPDDATGRWCAPKLLTCTPYASAPSFMPGLVRRHRRGVRHWQRRRPRARVRPRWRRSPW